MITAYGGAVPDKATMDKDTFADSVNPYLNYINSDFVPQANALETNVNAKEASAVEASDAAIGAANYQGEWVSQGYTKGQSVSIGTARFSCKLTHATAQTPPNTTYWLQIYGIDDTTPTLVAPYSGSKTQELHDAQTVAIANLASASGSISNTATPVFAPIATTPTDLPFTETIPSTNTAIFNFDDASNTMVFSKNGSFNYTSNVTFGASTTDARAVTFDIVDTTVVTAGAFVVGKTYIIVSVGTTDFTLIGASSNTIGVIFTATGVGSGTGTANNILGSEVFNVDIAANTTTTIASNTLLTVGSNGIPSAPLTIKIQVRVDVGATVDLISFSSTLVTTSIVNEGALADAIHSTTTKATPDDADEFGYVNSAGGAWSLVKMTGANLKAWLKSYFDTIYFSVMPVGTVIQVVKYQTGTMATGTATIPADATTPQITEGTQFMSLAFTPQYSNSKLEVEVVVLAANSSINATISAALFRDSTADTIGVGSQFQATANSFVNIKFSTEVTAGATTPTTFTVRAGGGSPSTTTFNGTAATALFNGTLRSSITVREIKQ